MSRANKEPTPNEIRFVQEQLLGGKEPRYIKWVTKKKRDKVQDRLIVVGDYRIYSIKKKITGKKQIQRVGHLFDLVELFSSDVDKVILKFKDFDIDITATTAGIDLVFAVRRAFQEISYSFAEYAMPKIVLLPQERVLQDLPSIDPGPADGLLSTYVAFCDYYKQPPSQEFIKFIKDLVAKGSRELDLESCPGIERKEDSINFAPIRAALRHNTYFSSFSLKNVPRKEVTICIADTLMHNITLEKICLSGVDAQEAAVTALGNSLKRNQHNRVVDLDLSHNTNIKDKGALGLAEGLQGMSHSLTRLCLAFCNLGPKAISPILTALCFGKDVGWGICELDLSYNKLERDGSLQLANWFNQQGKNLKYLLLANTKLDVGVVMRSIKQNGDVRFLEEVDLSGNKIDQMAGQAVAAAVETLPSLNILNLARCSLQSGSAVAIVTAVASNTSIRSASINLSENELGPNGAFSISQILVDCNNISSLILRKCAFKKEGLAKLAEALGRNTTLRVLDLSLNFRSGTTAKMAKLINTLAESVQRHPALVHLSIAGDYNKFSIGKEIEPIIRCLNHNPSLEEIDISGNKMGDLIAVTLCDTLRVNSRLKYLSWDNNNISIGGWQALLNVLGQCGSLLEVPNPKLDSDRAIKDAKNKEQFKERVRVVLDGIQDKLKKNLGGQSYKTAMQQAKGRTYSVAVPMPEVMDQNSQGVYGLEGNGSPQQIYGFNNNNNNGYQSPPQSPPMSPPQPNYYQQQSPNYYQGAQLPPPLPTNNNNNNQGYDYYTAPPPPPERDPPYGTVKGPNMPPPLVLPPINNNNSGTSSPPPPTPPPPPPLSRKPTSATLTPNESKLATSGPVEVYDTFNFNETAIQADINIEYDDSNYAEDNGAPPPPPPPPF